MLVTLSWLLRWTDLLVLFFVGCVQHSLLHLIRTLRTPSHAVLPVLRRVAKKRRRVLTSSCNARGIRYPAWA